MSEPEDGPTDFLFKLPVWVLIYVPTFQAYGLPAGVAGITTVDGQVLVLFTDEDLGKRFLKGPGMNKRGLHPIHGMAEYITLLQKMKLRGVVYVAFDCPDPGGSIGGHFFPIDDVIHYAKQP